VVERNHPWTFLTNHAHVLMCVDQDNNVRIREIARRVGITERSAHTILRDLEDAGYISVTKTGRRNTYKVYRSRSLRHPLQRGNTVADLLKALSGGPPRRRFPPPERT
jgi:DNA-binding IclR family transcriptional regulator